MNLRIDIVFKESSRNYINIGVRKRKKNQNNNQVKTHMRKSNI
jgi:hypothetical protein